MSESSETWKDSLLDLLFEDPGAGQCLVAPDGRVLRVNDGWFPWTGAALGQVLGRRLEELLPETGPTVLAARGRDRVGGRLEIPPRVERMRGREARWQGSITPLPMEGGTGLLLTAREVSGASERRDGTERPRAEHSLSVVTRLYAVLSRVNEAIVRTRDEQLLYEEVCRIVGEESGVPLVWIGLVRHPEVVPAASWGRAASYLREIRVEVDGELGRGPTGTCVREGRPVINDDFDSNPSTLPWRAHALLHGLRASAAFPLRRHAKVVGALTLYAAQPGTFTPEQVELLGALSADVSYALDASEQERLRAEAELALRASEQSLREADRRKNEFIAMLSHELRNPLAPIRNSLYLLDRARAGSPQFARAKEVLRRQAEHLTRLVDDLVDVTRVSHGKIELRRAVVDARDVVQKTCADHASVFEQRGIDLHVEVPGSPLWVDVDPTRISQVLRNLLLNAAKFTHEGGTVLVRSVEAADRLEISVRDDGIGIEPEALARVFEPFVQAERGKGWARGGLGLGLALVKGLVEEHQGTVRAESAGAERGSRMIVTLPLVPAPERRQPPAKPPPPARPLDILVIEDNVDGAETLAALLELQGHRAHVANDGLSGLDRAREGNFDVILCDIDLPGLDGYEVARSLRAGGLAATRLIALSGLARAGDRQLAVEAGFNAHLAKPVSVDELNALLDSKA